MAKEKVSNDDVYLMEYIKIMKDMDDIIADLKTLPECAVMLRSALRHRNYVHDRIKQRAFDDDDIQKLKKRCQYMRLVIQNVT